VVSGPYVFTAGSQRITVTVSQESDGKYYVTKVSIS
jgi:hypothetical protein